MSWVHQLRFDRDVAEVLERRAAGLDVSQAELVREAVDFYLRYVTDDDVLLEVRKERLRYAVAAMAQRAADIRQTAARRLTPTPVPVPKGDRRQYRGRQYRQRIRKQQIATRKRER